MDEEHNLLVQKELFPKQALLPDLYGKSLQGLDYYLDRRGTTFSMLQYEAKCYSP